MIPAGDPPSTTSHTRWTRAPTLKHPSSDNKAYSRAVKNRVHLVTQNGPRAPGHPKWIACTWWPKKAHVHLVTRALSTQNLSPHWVAGGTVLPDCPLSFWAIGLWVAHSLLGLWVTRYLWYFSNWYPPSLVRLPTLLLGYRTLAPGASMCTW